MSVVVPSEVMPGKTAVLYEPGYVVAGKYELESLLGQGGMGAVWRAKNIALDSAVAIKVVRAAGDKALLRGRLLQEARAAAKLTHPAIVKVFDVGQTESGDPFIVMELLHGDSLGKILEKEGRLSAVQAVRSLLPICDALWLSHGKGIVHRDLKPDNVFIVQHEGAIQPTLVDFGIVKVQEADGESHLTKAGDVLGSPDYMSPEQARGSDDVNHLTDVWSFAVVLYESISGRTPFKGANYNALLRQIVEDTPPSLQELSVADADLSAIVARALSKLPSDRFQSMGELGRALAAWLVGRGVSEDICGATLETKWMRGTDPHGRGSRATMTSIVDAWPIEGGSGVRRNAGAPVNTLPAPPGAVAGAASSSESGAQAAGLPRRLPVKALAAGVGVLTAALLGFLLFARSDPAPIPVPEPPRSTVISGATAAPEQPATAPLETAAQPAAEPVSSAVETGSAPAVLGKKPARKAAPKRSPSTGKAKTKPGDLMSPY
jgi:predicted Ser/Thr protein kinase